MADPRDLCTLADVKALMQKSGANAAAQDALIQSLITRASIKIMRDYGREFVPGGPNSEIFTNATRTFEFERDLFVSSAEVFVDLYPYDLQITPAPTVVIDSDLSSATTITAAEFRLWPQPPAKGVYEAIRLALLSARYGWPRYSHRQITVTGNWGFPSIPFEVTQATAETVIHWITNYPGARRVDQVDSAIPAPQPRSYPMTAVDLLRAFERVTV